MDNDNKKSKDYSYIFALVLIMIFVAYVCVAFIFSPQNNTKVTSSAPVSETIINKPNIVKPSNPTTPSEPDVPTPPPTPSVPTQPTKEVKVNQLLERGFSLLNTDKSFTSVINQTFSTPLNTQKVKIYTYKNQNAIYRETYSKTEGAFGANYFKYYFVQGDNVETRKATNFTFDGNVSFESNTVQTTNYNSFKTDLDGYEIYSQYLTINLDNAILVSFEEGSSNYTIKIKFKNEMISTAYINNTKELNDFANVVYKELYLTFDIDKTSGHFNSIEKQENFDATFYFLGMTWFSTSTSKEVFSNYNNTVNIVKR